MKLLAERFGAHGHYLRQIWRGTDVAVYERSLCAEHPAHELELVFIRVVPETAKSFGGPVRILEEHEAYPRDSQWGTMGFSFPIGIKTLVLDLARQATGITKNRATFIRNSLTELKAKQRMEKMRT